MAALEGSVPENALLSHDLFEGLYARVALVSDVELVDEYPSSVLTHARRQHRWIRGDWQILLWLLPVVPSGRGLKRNTLPLIARWKIFDNLRRSLLAPSLLALLVAGWTLFPGANWFWTAAVAGVLASQLLPLAARLLIGPGRAQSIPVFLRNLRNDSLTALAQVLLGIALLAYHAADSVHAIVVTLVRLAVTGRRLLEWETAAAADARASGMLARRGFRLFVVEMRASPIIAAVAGAWIAARDPAALPLAAPFLLSWLAAPAIAYRLSIPAGARARPLTEEQRRRFRETARKTWRYFESFVGEGDGWLPPDNYQEHEDTPRIAHRTSPTNIAMGLLSTLAAHDLGYLSTPVLVERLDRMLTALEGLERYQGHFLNWYVTTTRAPLHPRYVSTVDSGNLGAALIALAYGLRELNRTPQILQQRLDGLADTAGLLALASATSSEAASLRQVVTRVNELARSLVSDAMRYDEKTPTRFEMLAMELADAAATL